MKKLIHLSILFFIFSIECFSQNNCAASIMERIRNDEDYLWKVKYIQNIQKYDLLRKTNNYFRFNITDTTGVYSFAIYYYENKDNIVPLAVKQLCTKVIRISNSLQSLDNGNTDTEEETQQTDTSFILSTDDLKNMYESKDSTDRKVIGLLINLIRENEKNSMETFGFNNTNYILKDINKNKQCYTSFIGIVNARSYPSNPPTDTKPYIGFNLPGLSLSIYNIFNDWIEELGLKCLKNFGLEFGLRKDNILNLQEFQNPVFTPIGLTLYFNILDNLYADTKIYLQKKFGNRSLANKKDWWPIFDFNRTQINKASGVSGEVHFFGSIGNVKLPCLNLYGSYADLDFSNPVYTSEITPETKQAYYSLNQYEFSLSFFWDLDNEQHNKLRFDLGGGCYDIYQVIYDSNNKVIADNEINNFIDWQPVLAFEYIHSSNAAKFGSFIRYFDNRLMLKNWLRLIDSQDIEVRIEDNFISESLKEDIKVWEHNGSSNMVQLVFRYGLK